MPGPEGSALPEGFLLGVATSGFQIEGGFNGPGEPANNWLWWERSGRVVPSGIACDFWRQPDQALDRAADIGCNAFRLSVEWARIEPEPEMVDSSALDRYVAILTACAERGIEPVISLHHFTHPAWLGEEFWLTPGSPERFAAHVERVLPALAPWCRHWVTINEPNIVALMGWITGDCPPGRRMAVSDAFAVLDNLLAAHVLAYRAIHRVQPGATVTVNTSSSSIYEHDRLLTDLLSAPRLGVARDDVDTWIDQRRAAHQAACPPHAGGEAAIRRLFAAASPYGSAVPGPLGSRLRRSCPRRVLGLLYDSPLNDSPAQPALDAVGFDWYDPIASHAVRWPGHESAGRKRWSADRALWDVPADPPAMTRWCDDQHRLLPDLPLWVVENGMATLVHNGRAHHRGDGWDRPRYLRAHLKALLEALDAGTPVTAYLHWSLVDNYEWGTYDARFGLFGVDRARGERGIRWMETDAEGHDAAGEFRRLARGLRLGDRSVLEPAD